MNFLRSHWFDIGGTIGGIILLYLLRAHQQISNYRLLMWLSLTSLFFHQMEEYRIVGTFPGMINSALFHSDLPDRYPLNTNTSLVINVCVGWSVYLLAAIAGKEFVWLGVASILVSLGNIIAHTFIFNIKGKTFFNAGLATCWLCFAPCVFYFFKIIYLENLVTGKDLFIGIPLGIVINTAGVFMPIKWLANRRTTFIFKTNQLLPKDRWDSLKNFTDADSQ